MKLDAKGLPKALRKKDVWIVVGGAAAVVTAFVALRGGGGSQPASRSATDPLAELPAGGTTPPQNTSDLQSLLAMIETQLTTIASNTSKTSDPVPTFVQPAPAPAPVVRPPYKPPPVVYPAPTVSPPRVTVGPAPTIFDEPAVMFTPAYQAALEKVHGPGGARDPFAGEEAGGSWTPNSGFVVAPWAQPALEKVHGPGGARDPFAGEDKSSGFTAAPWTPSPGGTLPIPEVVKPTWVPQGGSSTPGEASGGVQFQA